MYPGQMGRLRLIMSDYFHRRLLLRDTWERIRPQLTSPVRDAQGYLYASGLAHTPDDFCRRVLSTVVHEPGDLE